MKFNKLLKESQFHGGRRLAERNCRWCWMLSMALLFVLAVAAVCSTVGRYFDNPTYMAHLESTPNRSHFPSVMVCPEIFYSKENIARFLDQVKIPADLNVTYLSKYIFILAAFYAPEISFKTHDLKNIEHLLEYNNMDVDTAARMLTTDCESTLIRCRWRGYIVNCSDLFRMELSGDEYCCVFNGRSLTRDKQRRNNITNDVYFADSYGYESGLMLAVNQSQAHTSINLSYKWIAIQTGHHYVESSINGSALNPGSEQWAEYHQHYFQIAEDARSLSDHLRQCRMASKPLQFFPIYNRKYCVVECERAHILKRCKCILLVHPRSAGGGDPHCTAQHFLCVKNSLITFDKGQCNCPLTCDIALDYVKFTSFELRPDVLTIDTFYDNLDFSRVTIVRVFLLNERVRTESRRSYFTSFDLFAQLGGVFNVFFGCSVLTLLELLVLVYRGISTKILQSKTITTSSAINNKKVKRKSSINIKQKPSYEKRFG